MRAPSIFASRIGCDLPPCVISPSSIGKVCSSRKRPPPSRPSPPTLAGTTHLHARQKFGQSGAALIVVRLPFLHREAGRDDARARYHRKNGRAPAQRHHRERDRSMKPQNIGAV